MFPVSTFIHRPLLQPPSLEPQSPSTQGMFVKTVDENGVREKRTRSCGWETSVGSVKSKAAFLDGE